MPVPFLSSSGHRPSSERIPLSWACDCLQMTEATSGQQLSTTRKRRRPIAGQGVEPLTYNLLLLQLQLPSSSGASGLMAQDASSQSRSAPRLSVAETQTRQQAIVLYGTSAPAAQEEAATPPLSRGDKSQQECQGQDQSKKMINRSRWGAASLFAALSQPLLLLLVLQALTRLSHVSARASTSFASCGSERSTYQNCR